MKPYYSHANVHIYCGDAREVDVPGFVHGIVTDPPYEQTSLEWDRWPEGWLCRFAWVRSLWVCGTLRMFMERSNDFRDAGWTMSQDLVWEKHNGSSFHADRFRRVHEAVAHFYQGAWADLYKSPPTTPDATKRTVRRKQGPPHMGIIGEGPYVSHDGGPRLMRSVLTIPSCHGYAEHPTQKPLELIRPLIEYSIPSGGVVLDPFMGSGSTLVAAKQMGRTAIGIEANEAFCEIAARRLSQETLNFEGAA